MLKTVKNVKPKDWLLAVGIGVSAGLISGCAAHWVKLDTPQEAQKMGVPEEVSVADSPRYQEEFNQRVALANAAWDGRYDAAKAKVDLIDGAVGALVSADGFSALGFNPYGGVGASALYLFGLLRKRPGDVDPETVAKEKQDSFNKGHETGTKAVVAGIEKSKETPVAS